MEGFVSTATAMIPIARPLISEEEKQAVLDVLSSGQLAQGAVTQQFEETFAAFCGVRHAVATSSGTTALHLAVLAHGIGPGDEVITTPFTFVASANCILYCGAKPVFVDIEPDTFNIDPDRIEGAITSRTKAILPVHLYGNPADMAAITTIAERHGLIVIEDAAQAHGARIAGRRVGSLATGCFSFYPTKNMTTGEGGIVTTNDDALADRLRILRAHGARERYRHEVLGYNFRLTDLQAAIGLAQMSKLREWTDRRQANAARLTKLLAGHVVTPISRPWAEHVYHQYTIRLSNGRGDLPERLATRGVGCGVHYPLPVHHQPLYRDLGYDDDLPEAERASREVLSLPVHPSLTDDDLALIAWAVIDALGDVSIVRRT
jgi:dTDP-4-amino-4,6-dideoxygalactose transaminase